MSEPTWGRAAEKQEAAERAVSLVRSGMVVGLGTGSTARFAVTAMGRRLKQGEFENILGIPTSEGTRELALACDIPLTTLEEHPVVDITIDGADEVDRQGNLIKGGGGALLWEKIVAAATQRYVIVVDETKLVARLGQAFPLPVEVVAFGWKTHETTIRGLGAEPALRVGEADRPYRTDEGHFVLDCRFPDGIRDPAEVAGTLRARPGVVETGLFLDMAPEVLVGRAPKA